MALNLALGAATGTSMPARPPDMAPREETYAECMRRMGYKLNPFALPD